MQVTELEADLARKSKMLAKERKDCKAVIERMKSSTTQSTAHAAAQGQSRATIANLRKLLRDSEKENCGNAHSQMELVLEKNNCAQLLVARTNELNNCKLELFQERHAHAQLAIQWNTAMPQAPVQYPLHLICFPASAEVVVLA